METTTVSTTVNVNTVFQVANKGFENMLNNQFRDWNSPIGTFIISPTITFDNVGELKTVQLPPVGKLIKDTNERKCFYLTFRQASSIANIHEQGIEWNREHKFLHIIQTIMDSNISPKILLDSEKHEVMFYKLPITIKFDRTKPDADSNNPDMEHIELDAVLEVRIPDYQGANPSIKILQDGKTISKEQLEKVNILADKFKQKFDVVL